MLDPDRAAPEVKARLQHVDGFADPVERVVYLNERSDALGHALMRGGVWDCVVTIVVWHEMAHRSHRLSDSKRICGSSSSSGARSIVAGGWGIYVS